MPGFLSATALHSHAAGVPPGDNVPDGAAAISSPPYSLVDLTRTVGGAELNPPLVTLTEGVLNDQHIAYDNGAVPIGPVTRARAYLRAGTRRYVTIVTNNEASWSAVTADTQGWTISGQGVSGGLATINSASLTDVGNGDWLLEVNTTFSTAGNNWSAIHGALVGTSAEFNLTYQGNSSTILIRRLDVATVTQLTGDIYALNFAAGATAANLTTAGFTSALSGNNYSEPGAVLSSALEISSTWGLVVNPAHINLADSSDIFSGTSWNKVNTTATADIAGADPNGGNLADRITETAVTNVHSVQAQNANTGVVSTKYCFSVCVKPETITRVKVYGALGVAEALFLLTGSGSLISQTGTLRTFIYPIGNGWFRCGIIWNCTNASVIPGVRALNASNADNYLGVVTNTMLLFRAGLEVEPYAPPAQTTSATNVTVAAGTVIATRTAVAQGTVLIKARTPLASTSANPTTLYCLDDNSASNRIILQWTPATETLQLLVVSGGSTLATLSAGTVLPAGTDFKLVARFGAADYAVRYGFAAPVANTVAALPAAGLTHERLGSHSAGGQWHSRIWRAERWSSKLSDADMQAALDAA